MQLLVGLPKGEGRRWARSRYFMLLSDWQNLMHDDSNGIGAVAMTEKFCTFDRQYDICLIQSSGRILS